MNSIKPHIVKDGDSWMVLHQSELEDDILNFLYESWRTKRGGYFPGPLPISIERKHFPLLLENPYAVCEKSDGTRYNLICKLFKGAKVCCLINRALHIRIVSVNVSKVAYEGTVMDGELVNGNKFIIYDAVKFNGMSVMKDNLVKRLEIVSRFVSGIIKTKRDSLNVVTKKFYNVKDILTFQREILPTLDYKTDGYIFTPVMEPLTIGTHETMFKWKPKDKNTIDFQFKKKGEVWQMFIQEKGRLLYESEFKIKNTIINIKENSIVECKYTDVGWIPQSIRTDKVHPNNRRTYYNTLKNIQEDIQITEFHQLFA